MNEEMKCEKPVICFVHGGFHKCGKPAKTILRFTPDGIMKTENACEAHAEEMAWMDEGAKYCELMADAGIDRDVMMATMMKRSEARRVELGRRIVEGFSKYFNNGSQREQN